jgi:undecaprenyl diphosphate synthase
VTKTVNNPAPPLEHVAIIMDGNGRWARRRRLPRLEGHRQGAKAVRRVVEFARRNGIRFLTLYAFSTENWRRPKSEVSGLMELLSRYLATELDELDSHDIRFRTIGNVSRLPAALLDQINAAVIRTRDNQTMTLNVALSYGGRQDIVNAAKQVVSAVQRGEFSENDISEGLLANYLDTAAMPDPDLLIRTGGELRISNFLLWQVAYAELYFTETLWPDFDDRAFTDALQDYTARQRRYGKTGEQVLAEGDI